MLPSAGHRALPVDGKVCVIAATASYLCWTSYAPVGPTNTQPARAPAWLPSHKTVTSRCSCRLNRLTTAARAALALPICGRSFSGQLDRRLRDFAVTARTPLSGWSLSCPLAPVSRSPTCPAALAPFLGPLRVEHPDP